MKKLHAKPSARKLQRSSLKGVRSSKLAPRNRYPNSTGESSTGKRFQQLLLGAKDKQPTELPTRHFTLADKATGQSELGPQTHRDRFQGRLRQDQLDEPLAFTPPPQVLQVPIGSETQAMQVHVAGSGTERAQAAALAERLVSKFRVGMNGDQKEVRMNVSSRFFGDVEVRLSETPEGLVAELHGASRALPGLAQRLEAEMADSGIALNSVEIEWT